MTRGDSLPSALKSRRNALMRLLVERFPSREALLLPTSFGNTIRAFEEYPLRMYGADSIVLWDKLIVLVPDVQRRFLEDAVAQMNFWVNLWFLSLLFLVELSAFAYHYQVWLFPWQAGGAYLLLMWVIFSRAVASAYLYGKVYRSTFDLFLPALYVQLQLPVSPSEADSRAQWQAVNQALLYVRPDLMPSRSPQPRAEDP